MKKQFKKGELCWDVDCDCFTIIVDNNPDKFSFYDFRLADIVDDWYEDREFFKTVRVYNKRKVQK